MVRLRHHGVPHFLNSSECMAAFITFWFIIDFFTINIEHGCNIHVIPGWEILQYWIRLTPEYVLLQLWWIFCFINNIHRNFEMSINESIQFKIIIIFSEWIIQSLGNSEPAKEEEKLDGHEDGIVELDLITDPLPIDLSPDLPLLSDERHGKVDINCQGDYLGVDEWDRDMAIRSNLGKGGAEGGNLAKEAIIPRRAFHNPILHRFL